MVLLATRFNQLPAEFCRHAPARIYGQRSAHPRITSCACVLVIRWRTIVGPLQFRQCYLRNSASMMPIASRSASSRLYPGCCCFTPGKNSVTRHAGHKLNGDCRKRWRMRGGRRRVFKEPDVVQARHNWFFQKPDWWGAPRPSCEQTNKEGRLPKDYLRLKLGEGSSWQNYQDEISRRAVG
jgi:hypothetical protein